jgi:hypothetical protein
MGRMLRAVVPLVAIAAGCTQAPEPPRVPEPPRPPVGFIGDWVRLTPRRLQGDTLSLRADSTADGVILWNAKEDARATRWLWRYGSRAPAGSQADWRRGYHDGGDADCVLGRATAGCTSMPMICLGASREMSCTALAYVAPDSLFLADGSNFVRAASVERPTRVKAR